MNHPLYTIAPALPEEYDELLAIWEESARATHHFLREADIQALKPLVRDAFTSMDVLLCGKDARGGNVGFMGVAGGKIEMLFLHPLSRGRGLGRMFVERGVRRHRVTAVDVNEQNEAAAAFYDRLGFAAVGRSERDGQGNPFPLLKLKLKENRRG